MYCKRLLLLPLVECVLKCPLRAGKVGQDDGSGQEVVRRGEDGPGGAGPALRRRERAARPRAP